MDREQELAVVRRAYAKQIMAVMGTEDPRVEAAFADVRREHFLGDGPWQILHWSHTYRQTPSADPVYLYSDDLVALDPARHVNNGQPSYHAMMIARAAAQPGEHVVHVGAGVGYYTAIFAHMVGSGGKVTAIESDKALAQRTFANFREWPRVSVIQGDGAAVDFDPADVIYVSAGATRPADRWLDGLRDGGRLIVPLTTNASFMNDDSPDPIERRGAVFHIERAGDEFLARWIGPIAIVPCEGVRDTLSEAALVAAFKKGGWERVTRLYCGDDLPEDRWWLRAPTWCLAYS
jgi:protein-L-isoaspartate(D-aspartate) O-methyltransferase